ncbi:MAG TPA: HPP family protein [Xanthobacteraceae bacterium]|nr:HPP family protein [Xanthobacteraceae bacterium]
MDSRAIIAGAAGGAVAIAVMELLSARTMTPLMTIPFATSIVLVMGSPEADPAQPRALVGGHLVAALVGLVIVKLVGPNPWAAALAVGLAMVAMHLTGTFHPPAGINPLLVVVNNFSWTYLIVPVACGALLLVGFAYAWHNVARRGLSHGRPWPSRWW